MRLTLLGILLGGLLLAAACGGDDEKTTTATATRATSGASGSPGGVQQINATLQEYSIILERKSAKAGKITFTVENKGPNEAHEFHMFKTDTPLNQLSTQPDGALDEESSELEEIDEIVEFSPGQRKSMTVEVEPGRYILVCNVGEETGGQQVRHFQQGMVTEFTVE